ncbi:hypothetical protein CQJ94_08230 [Glycomyces fuscus]|nr:hypothetical protein CQJ94_08230 [Glycomyces fuscus]
MPSSDGEEPPRAIADRPYSGRFAVRVPPEPHRRLALEAAEQHVSLNRLAAARPKDSSGAACGWRRGADGGARVPGDAGTATTAGPPRGLPGGRTPSPGRTRCPRGRSSR